MARSVLFLVPYPPGKAPSQRFRVELYEPVLREHGITYHIACFMDMDTWNIIFKPGNQFRKISGILRGYLRRTGHLVKSLRYDYIFIHREAAPLGPPVFEWILSKLLGKKIIYDFDDAIWIPNISAANKMAAWFKAFWKVKFICRWAHTVTGGNAFLNKYAAASGAKQTIFLPTCVDTERKHNKIKIHGNHKPVVGWTGSHSTLPYLDDIIPLIRELQEDIDFSFLVIADKEPTLDLENWQYIPWNETTEAQDLLYMDIGIMPLKSDRWSEGKCGFKLIQYMACGIPAVADPVGVNSTIIDNGQNGFVCDTPQEWKEKLKLLISNPEMRSAFGDHGRKKIVREYSIRSQAEKFVSLFGA